MCSGKLLTLSNKSSPRCQGRAFISQPAELGGTQLKGAGAAESGRACPAGAGSGQHCSRVTAGPVPGPGAPLRVQEPCCLCCAFVSGLAAVPPGRDAGPAQGWALPCSLLHCSRGAAPPSLAVMGHGGISAPPLSSSPSPGLKLSGGMLPSPAFSCPLPAPCSLQLTSPRASPDVLSSSPGVPSLGGPRCGALFG